MNLTPIKKITFFLASNIWFVCGLLEKQSSPPPCQFLYLQIPLHINSLIFAPISLSPIFPSHVLYPSSPLIFSTPCISLRPLHPPKLPSKAINNLWPPLRSQKRNKSMIKKILKRGIILRIISILFNWALVRISILHLLTTGDSFWAELTMRFVSPFSGFAQKLLELILLLL